MKTTRRWFASGALLALAAPAIIKTPGLLMPTSRFALDPFWIGAISNPPEFFVTSSEVRTHALHTQIVKMRRSVIEAEGGMLLAEAHVSGWAPFAKWRA